ncbi:MAG: NAD(P)/FAD-dependent oxidoreductase [Deltaproteobacteria bacterium]|nr:NAD(P)/FAD-dependent oxidoreductase [Deltaproteobacteria bacterium]
MEKHGHLPHVVIVGAGFGGLKAAARLRGVPAHVTVIDRSNHHLFQPLLYQVATAGLSPADIAQPIRNILKRNENTEVLMDEVTGVDVAARRVRLADREVPYDYLLLATGATHSYFNHPEWEKFAPGLKSIEDATTIRRKILLAFEAAEMEQDSEKRHALLTFVVVGAGPTGVELAGSIAELAHRALASDFRHINPQGARILLLEAGPRILASFSEKLAAKARRALEKLGVEARTGAKVEQVDAQGVLVSGERIAARTVIWAAGVRASAAARWLGVEADRAGRVKVQPDLTLPGHSDIFIIGDTATLNDEAGKPLPGTAPVAMQQGRYVAAVMARRIAGKKPLGPFHYVDKGNLATVGRSYAIAEIRKLRLSGFVAWITWLLVHILYLIGFRNRILVLIEWAWAYVTFQRGARLITKGPGS